MKILTKVRGGKGGIRQGLKKKLEEKKKLTEHNPQLKDTFSPTGKS